MNLHIDSSNNLKTTIKIDDQAFTQTYSTPRDQNVLGFIRQTLQNNNLSLSNLTSITVFTGPGSFTGLRVGISIANALSFALNLPINQKPPGTIITPRYGKPPSITLKK